MMENIMLDESYSFSMRQFDQANASKRDLQQASMGPAQFEASRMSNMSAYNNGDLSNRNSGRGQPSYGPMGNVS